MFYENFDRLCRLNNTSPYSVAIELGFSRSTPAYWKKAGNPPKREAVEKIAKYFGVSPEYLLGTEHTQASIDDIMSAMKKTEIAEKIAPIETNRSEMFAILGQLTDAELDDLMDYARFLISKR